jgi:hypothetical protein
MSARGELFGQGALILSFQQHLVERGGYKWADGVVKFRSEPVGAGAFAFGHAINGTLYFFLAEGGFKF